MTLASYSYNLRIIGYAIGIWAGAWGYRYWSGVDEPLDRAEKGIRWCVVGCSFVFIQSASPKLAIVRLIAGFVGVAFLAWPNLARSVGDLLRWIHILRPRSEA